MVLSCDNKSREAGKSTDSERTLRNGQETRATILQVARDLFHAHGYRGVSTRQIAAACGLTQPAIYRHFATKQNLYIAVLLDDMERLQARLLAITRRDDDLFQRLRAVTHILPVTWSDSSQMFHDIARELDARQREEVARHFAQSIIAPVAALFMEGMATGRLRAPNDGGLDATEATFALFRLLDDHTEAIPARRPPLQHADHMLAILMHGLATQSS